MPRTLFARDIPGTVTELECRALANLAGGLDVLEIGSGRGRSTIALASHAHRVHAIDWHRDDDHAGRGDAVGAFLGNLDRYGVRDRVVAHVGRVEYVAPVLASRVFGLVFVDGSQSEEEAHRRIDLALRVARPGAVLAFHGYEAPDHPGSGVRAAVDARLGSRIVNRIGSLAIVSLEE